MVMTRAMRWITMLLMLSSIVTIHGQNCTQLGQLRLFESASFVGANRSNAGRVEICMSGVWGTIAADTVGSPWSEKNAQVACIQLGFSGVLNAVFQRTIPFIERSTSPIHLIAIMCNGTESTIMDCPHSTSTQNVNHELDAYVVCRPKTRRYSYVHPAGLQSGDIRLFGDTRNGHGAVQIYTVTQGWQGICPDGFWTNSDASTICQQLGYDGGSVATPIDAVRGPGGEPLARNLLDAKCPGSAADDVTTEVCSFRIQSSTTRCASPEGRFAALQCSYAPDQSVRLIGGSHHQEGIVEIAYNGRWGILCNGGFQLVDAQATCQGLGFGTDDARVMSLSSSSQILDSESNLRPIWLNNLQCDIFDRNLLSCIREQNIIGFAYCQTQSIAAVDCGDPPPLSPGQIAGITIGVLVFVAIAIPLLVICLDENKKRATIAKLKATKARIAQIRLPRPRLPHPRIPRRQPQHLSTSTPSNTQPSTGDSPSLPAPEPLDPAPSNSNQLSVAPAPVAPDPVPLAPAPVAPVPLAPQTPELDGGCKHFSKIDEPPPYPGVPAYPPSFSAVSTGYDPPPPWSDPAYPPNIPSSVYPPTIDDTSHPADNPN